MNDFRVRHIHQLGKFVRSEEAWNDDAGGAIVRPAPRSALADLVREP